MEYKNPFENPDEKLWDKKVKDYKIVERKEEPKPAEPLEKKIGLKIPQKEKEPEVTIEFKKRCIAPKTAVKVLTKILKEYYGHFTELRGLEAYTKDKIKFEGWDILKAIRNGKKFVRFHSYCNNENIHAERNGNDISVYYDQSSIIYNIKFYLHGKENEIKKEREIVRKLL